jgi:hypothetical protein
MHFALLALYGGPDQVMTVTSGIASLVGFLLIFWHKLVARFFKLFGRPQKSPSSGAPEKTTQTSSQATHCAKE